MNFKEFHPLGAIALTLTGMQRLLPLCQHLGISLWVPSSLDIPADSPDVVAYTGSLKDHLAALWPQHRGFLFCFSTGVAVRLIAPLLTHKSQDPAVVVLDEAGQFAISLCSGHQGGADQLARLVALHTNATPVLTGASHQHPLPSLDILGQPFGWQRGEGDWTGVSAAMAQGGPIQVIQDGGTTLWQDHLPPEHPFQFGWPEYSAERRVQVAPPRARLWISVIQRCFSPESSFPKAQWHPRLLWVGVGCERGTSRSLIEAAILKVCQAHHLAPTAIAGIATLDLKADEAGLIELCRDRQWPLRCFPAADLREISVPQPSEVVEQAVGTPSVAEAAAIRAASEPIAPDPRCLRVTKQIIRQSDQPGAVTVAIAQAEREYTGRSGQLFLVGTGPGELSQMTPAAQAAIAQADAVIGYSLYVDLVRPLLHPGQIIEALPITQERQRAQRAIELAQWGLTVAVISSGDSGIYGMAGLVLEELRAQHWDGKTPAVQVFPGITALQAAAARVGAPLMHDFCAISLSDLLTPWPVIEKRLNAAALGDFVVALYNPRSRTRTQQLAIAQDIFLQHRDPKTPVALVRSAYRRDETVTLTHLGEFLQWPVDMLTTVLIGNSSTQLHAEWMITPRGYLGFATAPTEPAQQDQKV